MQIQIEADPDGAIAAEIEDRLIESLRRNLPPNDSEPLTLVAHEGPTMIGGLIGSTSYGWLLVKVLWVAEEMRGRGLGTDLMVKAEALARARGCHGVWLDTSSADAERFFVRLGYKSFGVLENVWDERPPGHRRIFVAKRFARTPSRASR